MCLEFIKRLLGTGRLVHFDHVETHGLAQRTALPDRHDVADGRVPAHIQSRMKNVNRCARTGNTG